MTRLTLTNVTYRQMFSRYAETDPSKINTNPLIALCGARYGLGSVNERGWVRSENSEPAAAFRAYFGYVGVFVEPWVMELDPAELNVMADLLCVSDERFREVVARADRRLTEIRHHASGQTELWEKAVAKAELRVRITEYRYKQSDTHMICRDSAQRYLAWMTAIDKLEKVKSQDVFKAKLAEQAEHHEDDLYRLLESQTTSDEIATNHGMTKYKGDSNAPIWKTILWEKK